MTVRRLKNYAGQNGYVFQYYFVGKRPATGGAEGPSMEYVFDASVDRHTYWPVSVFVQASALRAWAAQKGREMTEAEQYAVGKLALFEGFDEMVNIAQSGRRFAVTAENIAKLVDSLNLD